MSKPMGESGQAIEWEPTTEEWYWYSLEVLPPEVYGAHGSFLVGEPMSHRTCTVLKGFRPTYAGFIQMGEKFFTTSEAVTVAEFKAMPNPA